MEEKRKCFDNLVELQKSETFGTNYSSEWYLQNSACPFEIDRDARDKIWGERVRNAILEMVAYHSPEKFDKFPDAIQVVIVDKHINTGNFKREPTKKKSGWPFFHDALEAGNIDGMKEHIRSSQVGEERNRRNMDSIERAIVCPGYHREKNSNQKEPK